MRDLVIVGAGGHGRETLDVIEAINAETPTWRFRGFFDDGCDATAAERLERRGASVIADSGSDDLPDAAYVIGIGDPNTRAAVDATQTAHHRSAATLVHPNATIASDNRIADGVVIATGVVVTTNVTLDRHVHLNVGAIVSHDCVVGAHSTLSPAVRLNGNVTIGQRVFLGTGAIVIPGCSVGDDAVVGAGAVVISDVPAGATVVGTPAVQRQ